MYCETYDLEFVRGDSFDIIMNIQGDRDFSNVTVISQVRDKLDRLIIDLQPDFEGFNGGAIMNIARPESETESLPVGIFGWDIKFNYGDGITRTYISGSFTIKQNYSHG